MTELDNEIQKLEAEAVTLEEYLEEHVEDLEDKIDA